MVRRLCLEMGRSLFLSVSQRDIRARVGNIPNVVFSGIGVNISSDGVGEPELEDDDGRVGPARHTRSSVGSRKRVSISAMGFLVARYVRYASTSVRDAGGKD